MISQLLFLALIVPLLDRQVARLCFAVAAGRKHVQRGAGVLGGGGARGGGESNERRDAAWLGSELGLGLGG